MGACAPGIATVVDVRVHVIRSRVVMLWRVLARKGRSGMKGPVALVDGRWGVGLERGLSGGRKGHRSVSLGARAIRGISESLLVPARDVEPVELAVVRRSCSVETREGGPAVSRYGGLCNIKRTIGHGTCAAEELCLGADAGHGIGAIDALSVEHTGDGTLGRREGRREGREGVVGRIGGGYVGEGVWIGRRRIHIHRTRRGREEEVVGQTGRTEGDAMAALDGGGDGGRERVARPCGGGLSVELDVRATALAVNAFRCWAGSG